MNKYELKPCPFCGSATAPEVTTESDIMGLEEDDKDFKWYSQWYAVVCNALEDGCGARSGGQCFLPEQAVKRWNRRVVNE